MLKVIKINIFLGKVCCNQFDFSNSRGAVAESDLFNSFPNRNKTKLTISIFSRHILETCFVKLGNFLSYLSAKRVFEIFILFTQLHL